MLFHLKDLICILEFGTSIVGRLISLTFTFSPSLASTLESPLKRAKFLLLLMLFSL
ncbi:hypothetical protein Fmac_016039 [Flemingia macrophylla]|uniref:Uncharacterized protein n=1 Tax=Flemingia macrophylla TaxID=520843 RepID=A0ABD1MG91_9FABA